MCRYRREQLAARVLRGAAPWAALVLCCLANPTLSWGLSDSLLLKKAGLFNVLAPAQGDLASPTAQSASTPGSIHTSLQLSLGRHGGLTLTGLSFLGKASAVAGPNLALASRLTSPVLALGDQGGADLLAALPPADRAHSDQAYSYKLSYANTRLQLNGNFADVGARFSPSSGDTGGGDLEALKQALGTRTLQMSALWQLAPGASLSTERKSLRNDKPGDEKNGATITDTLHTLALALGHAGSLKASLADHEETWDRLLGKPDQRRQTTALEFTSQFGGAGQHGLRLALTNVATGSGKQTGSQATREAHLALRPTGRLGLAADYTAKSDQGGREQKTTNFGATFHLAGGGQLAATLKTITPDKAPRTNESSLQLNTSLGAGGSKGNLALQQVVTRAGDSSRTTKTNLSLNGALGSGSGAINLALRAEQQRGEGPAGKLTRTTAFHLDRGFGPRWKIVADCEQKMTGTNQAPRADLRSALALTAQLTPRSRVSLGLTSFAPGSGVERLLRDLVLEQALGILRLQAECHLVDEGPRSATVTGYRAEFPRGRLPEWAGSLPTAHEFQDTGEYLVTPGPPTGLEAPFAGLRLLAKQRRGGPDAGKDTLSLSHGITLFGRQYLQIGFQRLPEGTDGDQKDRPMDLNRRVLMVGSPLRHGLTGRLWLATEDSASDPSSRRSKLGFAVWGRLNQQDQVEASVSRDSERWAGADRDRTTVSVLFARKVSEESKVHLKVGYCWGGDAASSDTSRDYRVSLGYEKPI